MIKIYYKIAYQEFFRIYKLYLAKIIIMEDKNQQLKVFLVDVVTKDTNAELLVDRMEELEKLVDTYGGIVILQKYQKRQEPDHKTYVGKGKLEEIIFDMQRLGANTLII